MPDLPRDVGGGLLLRQATPADAEALIAFNGLIHRDPGDESPSVEVMAIARDLIARPHPTTSVTDFTLVEEAATGRIVSSLCVIPQTWTYDGVPIGVGRIELVGTLEEHRRRGLVRAQMELVHAWCAQRGLLMQVIAGIPNYYRQFGYDMAITMDGGRQGYRDLLPPLPEGASEPYRLRLARPEDAPFLASVQAHAQRRGPLACPWDAAYWEYELAGRSADSPLLRTWRVIECAADGQPVGLVAHAPQLNGGEALLTNYELAPGVSWLEVTPTVARVLFAWGDATRHAEAAAGKAALSRAAAEQALGAVPHDAATLVEPAVLPSAAPQDPAAWRGCESLVFMLGAEHPAYIAFGPRLPRYRRPYAWYARVGDWAGFLRQITPALEARLAASVAVGHTGELVLSSYRAGVRVRFERGRLAAISALRPPLPRATGRFPGQTFLQLLLGYRSLEELEAVFVDAGADEVGTVLLQALFPKRPSQVWSIE